MRRSRSDKRENSVELQIQVLIRALPDIVPTQDSLDIEVSFFNVKSVAAIVFGEVVEAIVV